MNFFGDKRFWYAIVAVIVVVIVAVVFWPRNQYGTFYAGGDKSTDDYAISSVNNNAAKTVTSDTHLYTATCAAGRGLAVPCGGGPN